MEETTPSDIPSEVAAAALSRAPIAAASDTVSSGDVVATSSASSNITSDEMMAAKERFYELLHEKNVGKKIKRTELLSEQEYDEICTVLNEWKVGATHSSKQNKWRQNYILLQNTTHSTALRWNKKNENLRVATKEQMFTIIMDVHKELGHAKDSRKTIAKIANKWYGITQEDVKLALHVCPICMASQTKIIAKQKPLKMMLSETVGSRGQMDLIDMTSQQDEGYCWILRLIDHLSGFGAVKALKSKTSKECGIAIIQILSFFPDLAIIQSDNGGEFLGETIKYINKYVNCVLRLCLVVITSSTHILSSLVHRHFPDTHIVRGRSRHPQSQGGIERGNAPFKTGLQSWMQEEKTTKWADEGIYIVQRSINKRPSRVKGNYSPYEGFFGKETGNGPKDILDKHIIKQCLTEDGLKAAVAFVQSEEHTMDDRRAPNFNDRIIEVIRKADAAFEEDDAEGESAKPAAATAQAEVTAVKEETKLESDVYAIAEDVVMEALLKTANANANADGNGGAKTEGDEEPAACTTPTKALGNRQRDTPRRGKIRGEIAAAQKKQAIAVNKKRRCKGYVEVLQVGDVCKIDVEGNTRAATDFKYLPVMVTECKQTSSKSGRTTTTQYRLASRDGYLKGWYARENLDHDPILNAKIVGIDTEKEGFRKDLTIATASALYNQSGGATTCGCKKTDCAKNPSCTCKSVGNYCTSKCHKGRGNNKKCTNCPPGIKPPPMNTNLCVEVRDELQQPRNHVLPAVAQSAKRAPTPDSDKKPAAKKKKKKRKRKDSVEEETVVEVRGGNPDKYESKKKPAHEAMKLSSKLNCKEDDEDGTLRQELQAGCVIEYYHPMAVAGTPSALRTETVIQVQCRQSRTVGEDDEVTLTMDNLDVLGGGHQVKIVQAVVDGKLTKCNGSYRAIEEYKVIESETRSIRDVLMESASSFRRCLVGNISSNVPDGMPADVLHPVMRESTARSAAEDNEEVPMNTEEMTRQRRSRKLEALLKQRKLDLEQQCIVNGALYGTGPWHEVLARNGGDDVTREHMERLRPEVWLSDVIVNYFLKKCLQQRDERMHQNDSNRKRSHFFTSFFMQNLFDELNGNANLKGQYNYRNVRSWYRYVPGRNIFNLEYIFFPTNIGNSHWTLTVAFMEEKRIQYYDSFKGVGKGEKYLKGVLNYLKDEHQRLFKSDMDTSVWRLIPCTEDTPQQTKYNKDNDFDCGVFVCLFADFIAMDCAPIFDFDEDCIDKCREWIALSIMKNCVMDYNLNA